MSEVLRHEPVQFMGEDGDSFHLRQLWTIQDDLRYSAAIQHDPDYFLQGSDDTGSVYATVEAVSARRLESTDDELRMGMWDGDSLVGYCRAIHDPTTNSVKIGYWVDKRHAGKGYATKAATRIAQESRINYPNARIWADVDDGNEASMKVLGKSGFARVGRDEDQHIFEYVGDILPTKVITALNTAPRLNPDDPRYTDILNDPDPMGTYRLIGDNFNLLVTGLLKQYCGAEGPEEHGEIAAVSKFESWDGASGFINQQLSLLEAYAPLTGHIDSQRTILDYAMQAMFTSLTGKAPEGTYDTISATLNRCADPVMGLTSIYVANADTFNPLFRELAVRLYEAGLPDRRLATYTGKWPPLAQPE